MTQPRLVIFDFDGTLADSFPWFLGVMNEVARRHRLREVDATDAARLRDLTAREIIAELGLPTWKLPRIAHDLRALATRDAGMIKAFPFVPDLVERLASADRQIAVVSSNSEENIRRVLGPALMARIRCVAAGASLFGKASHLRQVLKKAGVAAKDAVAIGDEPRDVDAAAAVGLSSIAVTWGYASAASLIRARPTALIADPSDLPPLLGLPT